MSFDGSDYVSSQLLPIESPPPELQSGPRAMHPGLAPSLLGKRGRDPDISDMSGVIEEGRAEGLSDTEISKQVMRHDKKRARTSSGLDGLGGSDADLARIPSGSSLKSLREADSYIDPPPPRTPLPAFYGRSSSPVQIPQSAHKPQVPVTLNLLAAPASPNAFGVSPFPFPEPPQSPTPAGPSRQLGGVGGRTDNFRSFGMAPIPRPRSSAREREAATPSHTIAASTQAAPSATFVDPTALSQVPELVPSSSDVLQTLQEDEGTDILSRRTMYGTELDSDSRFGDFGTGTDSFWNGSHF